MLNPDAPEYIPLSQSTPGPWLPFHHATATAPAGFIASPTHTATTLLYPFPCQPQVLFHQSPPSNLPPYGFSLSSLPPHPPPQDVGPISDDVDQPESNNTPLETRRKAELFPRVITGKKFVSSKHPRGCSSTKGGGLWSGGRRLGRSRLMSVDSRGTKPKESCHLKKHSILPLKHDEERTTVMIKNIPYEFTRLNLMEFLDKHCMSANQEEEGESPNPTAYDFLYLPIDFQRKKNKGYAFVNFTEATSVWKFFNAFNAKTWEFSNSPKTIRIVCARVQGKEALVDHFKKTYFDCESEEFLPVSFSPPRDGSGTSVKFTTIGRRGSESRTERNSLSLSRSSSV